MSNQKAKGLEAIPVPAPNVSASHPFKNAKNHAKLLQHIKDRMILSASLRDQLTSRYNAIDKDVAAYMKLSDEDKKRRAAQLEGKGPKGVAMHVPFVLLHLDDALTYFLNVFAPETGMFQALGKKDDQPILNSLAELMNSHADDRGYFREILKFCFDAMKYNLSGIRNTWESEQGNVVINDSANRPTRRRETIWQGNDLKCIDMYNTVWDPSVHPIDVHRKGEYVGEIEMITPFRLRKLAMDGAYFNIENITSRDPNTNTGESFYRVPPQLWDGQTSSQDDSVNWLSILNRSGNNEFGTIGEGIELWHMTIQLMPNEFGLKAAEAGNQATLETWRITIANGNTMIAAVHLPNAHGRLPYNFASPMEDNLGLTQKSIAEILAPFQNLGSFLVNTHMSAIRRNIWDLILYDPSIIDLAQIPEGDVAGRVPVLPAGYGKDINKAVWQNGNILDTKETMNQLMKVIELMQMMWPTSASASQVAGIDRAVEDQVTETVQSSNRRLQKAAKLIDDQAFKAMRMMMISNIQEYQPEITVMGSTGEEIQINPKDFRGKDYSKGIGQGLKTMDKQALVRQTRTLIQAILQSQEAAQQFDLPALLNGLSDQMDMRIDLSQYRKQVQAPAEVAQIPQGQQP